MNRAAKTQGDDQTEDTKLKAGFQAVIWLSTRNHPVRLTNSFIERQLTCESISERSVSASRLPYINLPSPAVVVVYICGTLKASQGGADMEREYDVNEQ